MNKRDKPLLVADDEREAYGGCIIYSIIYYLLRKSQMYLDSLVELHSAHRQ